MDISEIRQKGLRNNKNLQRAIRVILDEIGEKPDREGLQRTPFRYAKACEEWFGGYFKDPKKVLNRTFTEKSDLIIEGPISFYSHCEHHISPFFGEVWVAYVPNKYITGLDKLVKLVEIYARRLQIQERLTQQIADSLMEVLKPEGCMVIVRANHLCIGSRETRNQTTRTITSAIRGVFLKPELRNECLQLINLKEVEL